MREFGPWVTLLIVIALVLAILWLVGVRFNLDVNMIPPYEGLSQ